MKKLVFIFVGILMILGSAIIFLSGSSVPKVPSHSSANKGPAVGEAETIVNSGTAVGGAVVPRVFVLSQIMSINQKAIALLGTQQRANIAFGGGFLLFLCLVAALIVGVYWARLKRIDALPIEAPLPEPAPAPEFDIWTDFPNSPVTAKVAWGLSALFFLALVVSQTADSFSSEPANKFDKFIWLVSSALTFCTIGAFVTGLWQMGAFASLSVLVFFKTPATAWLIAVLVVWSVSACHHKWGQEGGRMFYSGSMKALVMPLLFGALGSLGGIYATVGAGLASLLILGTVIGLMSYHSATAKCSMKVLIVHACIIVLTCLSVGLVYFGIARGVFSFILMLCVSAAVVRFIAPPKRDALP